MVGKVKRVMFGTDASTPRSSPLVPLVQVICYVPTREELDDEELLDKLFFSKNDYRANRVAAKDVAQVLEATGRADTLKRAFSEKSKSAQDGLNVWTTDDHEGRGVERWACPRHGSQRQLEQFAAIMSVLETQEKLEMDGSSKSNTYPKDRWKQLGKVSSKASRKARHFARMMGKADSHFMTQMIKMDQQQQQAKLKIQNMAYLMGGNRLLSREQKRLHDDDNESFTSATDSLATGTGSHWVTADNCSLLNNSSDEDEPYGGPGDYEDADILFSSIEDVMDMDESQKGHIVPDTPRSKTRRLRLLKKLKRRISATGAAGTSDSLRRERSSVPLDISARMQSPPRRRASTSTQSAAEIALRNPMFTPRRSSMPFSCATTGTPVKKRTITPSKRNHSSRGSRSTDGLYQ